MGVVKEDVELNFGQVEWKVGIHVGQVEDLDPAGDLNKRFGL